MRTRRTTSLFLAMPCMALHACVAALVPAAVGGMVARHGLTHARAEPGPPRTVGDTDSPAEAPAAEPRIGDLDAAPADLATMVPGKLYRGVAPARDTAVAVVPPPPITDPVQGKAVTRSPGPRAASDWNDVSRYVAGQFGGPSRAGVLLARGSALAAPRWIPCAAKPVAILTDLETVVPSSGRVPKKVAGVLGAVETLEITVVYTTQRTGPDLAKALAALTRAELKQPANGSTLVSVAPDQQADARATVGAKYCVIAIASGRAEDFPNGMTPESAGGRWGRGWFLVPRGAQGAK